MNIEKTLEAAKNIKLSGGVFGKLTQTIIIICICVTAITITAGNIYLSFSAIAAIIIFSLYVIRRLLAFTEKYPRIAILDGGEFVTHERIVHSAKGQGSIINTIDMEERTPTQLEIEEANQEEIPDIERIEAKKGNENE